MELSYRVTLLGNSYRFRVVGAAKLLGWFQVLFESNCLEL